MWKFINKTLIQHNNGYKIELIEGSWKEPVEIRPKFQPNTPLLECSKMLREGLEFGRKSRGIQANKVAKQAKRAHSSESSLTPA